MKAIIVSTTNPTNNKTQFWQVLLKSRDYVNLPDLLNPYGEKAKLHLLRDSLKKIDGAKMSDLQFIPLSIETEQETVNSRLQYRGYDNDKEPFVVRGKQLPEVVGLVREAAQAFDFVVVVRAASRMDTLTPGQASRMTEDYGQQLERKLTPALLKKIIKSERANIIQNAKADVSKLREQLREISAFKS